MIVNKQTMGDASNLVHKPLISGFTTVPSFIPIQFEDPLQLTDGPMDGCGCVHATESSNDNYVQSNIQVKG